MNHYNTGNDSQNCPRNLKSGVGGLIGLKRKAAQMGQIKAITEDPETGSLTLVVEV